jgi:F0F1-type ATP synthase assembly protein I
MLAAMEPTPRPTFQPAGAGMLLASTTAAGVGIGALVGWAAGSVGLGIVGGAAVGIPAGIGAVYLRYRDALS